MGFGEKFSLQAGAMNRTWQERAEIDKKVKIIETKQNIIITCQHQGR